MGKAEGRGKEWHGHVTAITVAPAYRRIGLAERMMQLLETVSDKTQGYFVDLFVRVSNSVAIKMYKKFGYTVYRRVLGYYYSSGDNEEDAFDMRKPLSRDVERQSIVSNGESRKVRPEDL
ncbi:6581_t:CDS:2 [Ambispora leptoticha]|uniref:6581_t:CDS:1 n=1 Tax=Ambispora leptoticha TaxID=144679 RepID=A0A9N9FM18_9GLOM|nr:6581_t:CDS:2 [Ambispora leptoticha]